MTAREPPHIPLRVPRRGLGGWPGTGGRAHRRSICLSGVGSQPTLARSPLQLRPSSCPLPPPVPPIPPVPPPPPPGSTHTLRVPSQIAFQGHRPPKSGSQGMGRHDEYGTHAPHCPFTIERSWP